MYLSEVLFGIKAASKRLGMRSIKHSMRVCQPEQQIIDEKQVF